MSNELDNLLDMSLDDLADLPEFKNPQPGAHRVIIKFEKKEINSHPAVELSMKLLETVELSDAAGTPDEPGMEFSVAYMLDNEFGQGKFKEILKPLAAHLNTSRVPDILEQSAGLECLVVTKLRANKEKTATYCDIASLTVI